MQTVQTSYSVTQPLFDDERNFFLGIKRTLYSTKVKIEWSNTSVPPIHLSCWHGSEQLCLFLLVLVFNVLRFLLSFCGEPCFVYPEFIFRY